jgi:hypothetical protein
MPCKEERIKCEAYDSLLDYIKSASHKKRSVILSYRDGQFTVGQTIIKAALLEESKGDQFFKAIGGAFQGIKIKKV